MKTDLILIQDVNAVNELQEKEKWEGLEHVGLQNMGL